MAEMILNKEDIIKNPRKTWIFCWWGFEWRGDPLSTFIYLASGVS